MYVFIKIVKIQYVHIFFCSFIFTKGDDIVMRKLQRFVALVLCVVLCMQLVTFLVHYSEGGQTVFAAESFVYGDLNGDNSLDSTDLTLLKRYLLRKIFDFPVEDDLKSADLNGDGEINSTDLTYNEYRRKRNNGNC